MRMSRRFWPRLGFSNRTPPRPAEPCFVIGDIHGRADLLDHALREAPVGAQIVCVGDYVDRGPDSASVLQALLNRPDVLCLKGNHEEMMLSFIDRPDQRAAAWLKNGGVETLQSFGIPDARLTEDGDTLHSWRETLVRALGPDLIAWLRALPLLHATGNVAIVHAAADPALPMSGQSEETLLWGHPDFRRTRRRDGTWIVHGHTVVAEPIMTQGVISIDTGAYATGRLSCAYLSGDDCTFVTVQAP